MSTARLNQRTVPPRTREKCLCKQLTFTLYPYALLEKDELSLKDAFTLATTLEKAQKNANVYNAASSVSFFRDVTACNANQEASSDSDLSLHIMEDQDASKRIWQQQPQLSTDKKCFYCGGRYHKRKKVCPTWNAHCFKCGLKGYVQAVCGSKKGKSVSACAQSIQPFLCGITSEYPQCLKASVTKVTVRNHWLHTCFD